MPAWREVRVVRVRDGHRTNEDDRAATEEPLEIRLDGHPFVVTMRTPGDDCDLAVGFLLSEQVITGPDDLASVDQCRTPDGQLGNVVTVTLAGAASRRLAGVLEQRRHVTQTSACGLCGRQSIASLATVAPRIEATWTIASSILTGLPESLRRRQEAFDRTGGLHAAGLFSRDGQLVEVAEDVGRHNPVDKVLVRMLRHGALPLSSSVLCVSGRASFELVQKAILAGIPMLVAVSAPSSLAIALAHAHGLTLAGFVRGTGFNIYTGAQRIA
ncbi:MAG: formate dehydrogenase accessory sulfurtransferase FdhD [Luteitalea sp.]